MNAHADVLVVGAGPSGIAAALAASRKGARVILADEGHESPRILDLPELSLDGIRVTVEADFFIAANGLLLAPSEQTFFRGVFETSRANFERFGCK